MDLKLGHYSKDGIEVIDVGGEIDIYTAPRLRELLIDLVSKGNYQLVVNLDKVGFPGSTGLGVLVGGLKRVRGHDGWLDLVCTQARIMKIFRITGLTEVFGIYETVDQAIAARRGRQRNVSPGEVAGGASGLPAGGRSHPRTVKQTIPAWLLGPPALQRLSRRSPGGAVAGPGPAGDHVVNRSILDRSDTGDRQ